MCPHEEGCTSQSWQPHTSGLLCCRIVCLQAEARIDLLPHRGITIHPQFKGLRQQCDLSFVSVCSLMERCLVALPGDLILKVPLTDRCSMPQLPGPQQGLSAHTASPCSLASLKHGGWVPRVGILRENKGRKASASYTLPLHAQQGGHVRRGHEESRDTAVGRVFVYYVGGPGLGHQH